MLEIKVVRWNSWFKDFETKRRNLVIDRFSSGQEANADSEGEGWHDWIWNRGLEDKLCNMVLNFLEIFNEVFWRTSKWSTTEFQMWQNKSTEKGFSGINRGDAANLTVAQMADISNMLAEWEGLVKCDTKIANRGRQGDWAAFESNWQRQPQNGFWGADQNHFSLIFLEFQFIYIHPGY